MIKRTTALRYAKALFQLDKIKNSTEQRVKEFYQLMNVFENHPKLVKFLNAPLATNEKKIELLQPYLEEINDPFFSQFLFYLIQKQRFVFFNQITSEYETLRNQLENRWEVKWMTCVPVDTVAKETLRIKLETFYQKKIHIKEELDPHILGGSLLLIGNQAIDWTIKTRLKKFKDHALTLAI